ncbi:MAG: toprim domain-containing protein [bacterium]|nr:toprim domain-containing protein [bacterium]
MTTFDKLSELFRSFPGIGPRQAKRFVYFLLSCDSSLPDELIELISMLKKETVQCTDCFRFFQKRGASILCPICGDTSRDTGELIIVARDTDLEAIEKSNTYHGKYFVLGGTLALIERKHADKLRMKELTDRVSRSVTPAKAGVQPLKEVILALSANPDGEHTSDELKTLLAPLSVKISTLGRGLSTGSELEYADKETLKSALKNRSSGAS